MMFHLENAIVDSKSFEKYNLTNEIENILSILNRLIFEKGNTYYHQILEFQKIF